MRLDDLLPSELEALQRSLAYWNVHWDWESPLLFGLQQNQIRSLIDGWPEYAAQDERVAALGIVGALRELLYGASSVNEARVLEILGISYSEANALLDRLMPRIDHALR